MTNKTTRSAMEDMSMPVVPVYIATPRATLAGMTWINVNHGNTTLGGLVLDESAELSESPRVLKKTLFFTGTDSLPNIP